MPDQLVWLMPRAAARIAVIGAGASGTLMALHLATHLPPGAQVLLCEAREFACGAAYASGCTRHLLNVRAANMSAFPDDPAHFERFLADAATAPEEVRVTPSGTFAARAVYRRYLCSLFEQAKAMGSARMTTLRAEIVDLIEESGGWRMIAADGAEWRADGVVLALGNLPSRPAASPLHVSNPWAPGALDGLRPDLPVLIVGAGLTMYDLALQLHEQGFSGPVIAVSRRGLLPHPHAPSAPWPTPDLATAERASVRRLLQRVRAEVRGAAAAGVDWRGVIDSLRPITASLWQGWDAAERRRFLRHVRPYWDIHRHRAAAPLVDAITALRDCGYLRTQQARVVASRDLDGLAHVTLRPRGAARNTQIVVQRVIRATGLERLDAADSRLIAALLRRKLARADALGIGLDVGEDFRVRDQGGLPAAGLWALGPLVRGVFWECIAVPDIRRQAAALAVAIATAPTPARAV